MTARAPSGARIDADIAIVGAGPAGAASACHFARAGFRVVVFDQERFPRDKVCGDFVGPTALDELERLHVLSHEIFRSATRIRAGALSVNGAKVIGCHFPRFGSLRPYGLCVPRMLMDEAIVRCAVASGARLIEDARVKGYETDRSGVTVSYEHGGAPRSLRARFLVGADGSSSLISRILRRTTVSPRDRIVAVRAYFDGVQGTADQADLYVNSSCFPGYYWVFPTASDSANVGIGMPLEAWTTTGHRGPSRALSRYIASDPVMHSRLGKAAIRGKIAGWPLVTFNPRLPVIANRVALLGDAAGFINPLSGEGIQYALRSARWCAETLFDALSSDTLSPKGLLPYALRVEAEMRGDMALSRFIIDVTMNQALKPLWLSVLAAVARRAAHDPDYYDLVAGVFAGIVPVRELWALPFFWGMAKSTVGALQRAALEVIRRPYGSRTLGPTGGTANGSILRDSLRHPVATMRWCRTCTVSALDLVRQMAISTN